jgi:hypothetical protein
LSDWCSALTELGFTVTTLPMNKGTPFANILLIARLGPNQDFSLIESVSCHSS